MYSWMNNSLIFFISFAIVYILNYITMAFLVYFCKIYHSTYKKSEKTENLISFILDKNYICIIILIGLNLGKIYG